MLPVGHSSTRGLGAFGGTFGCRTRQTFLGGASTWNRTVKDCISFLPSCPRR
jgi:hypothetical protein